MQGKQEKSYSASPTTPSFAAHASAAVSTELYLNRSTYVILCICICISSYTYRFACFCLYKRGVNSDSELSTAITVFTAWMVLLQRLDA